MESLKRRPDPHLCPLVLHQSVIYSVFVQCVYYTAEDSVLFAIGTEETDSRETAGRSAGRRRTVLLMSWPWALLAGLGERRWIPATKPRMKLALINKKK